MKLNLIIKTTKNYQTVELSATDIEVSKYPETKMWLIREAQFAINELVPGENVSQMATQVVPQAPAQPKAVPASPKQINLLHTLGYTGPTDNLTVVEASTLIDDYFKKAKHK